MSLLPSFFLSDSPGLFFEVFIDVPSFSDLLKVSSAYLFLRPRTLFQDTSCFKHGPQSVYCAGVFVVVGKNKLLETLRKILFFPIFLSFSLKESSLFALLSSVIPLLFHSFLRANSPYFFHHFLLSLPPLLSSFHLFRLLYSSSLTLLISYSICVALSAECLLFSQPFLLFPFPF